MKPFEVGDRIVPIDPREMWARVGYELKVLECQERKTRPGWTLRVLVSIKKGEVEFVCLQPAEAFKRLES